MVTDGSIEAASAVAVVMERVVVRGKGRRRVAFNMININIIHRPASRRTIMRFMVDGECYIPNTTLSNNNAEIAVVVVVVVVVVVAEWKNGQPTSVDVAFDGKTLSVVGQMIESLYCRLLRLETDCGAVSFQQHSLGMMSLGATLKIYVGKTTFVLVYL
jgi:hypothetical protein